MLTFTVSQVKGNASLSDPTERFSYNDCNIIYNNRQLIVPSQFFKTKALYLFFEESLQERRAVLSFKRGRAVELCMQMRKLAGKHGQIN